MNHVVRWNVRNRFMVAFVLVAVIPLVVFAALVYSRTAKALREVEKSQIAAHATGAREALGQRITDERAFVRDYAVWDEFHAAMLEGRRQWIRDNVTGWVPDSSSTDLVTVYDPSGRVVARAGDGAAGPCGRASSCGPRAAATSAPTWSTWTGGSTCWPRRPSSRRRTRPGRRACSSSARRSPTRS